jgi:hypothetical protein
LSGGACFNSHWVSDGGVSLPSGAFTPIAGTSAFGRRTVAADFTSVPSSAPQLDTTALLSAAQVGLRMSPQTRVR